MNDTTPAPIGADALREALIEAQAGLEDDDCIQEAEIDLHRLQHIESAALQALGILWMSERASAKTQDAFRVLRNALGGQNALRKGIESAIDAGHEADHPPGADWWAGKKEHHHEAPQS